MSIVTSSPFNNVNLVVFSPNSIILIAVIILLFLYSMTTVLPANLKKFGFAVHFRNNLVK